MQLLNSQVPLKLDEKHCSLCMGYGALSVKNSSSNETPSYKGMWHVKVCSMCQGVGKFKK